MNILNLLHIISCFHVQCLQTTLDVKKAIRLYLLMCYWQYVSYSQLSTHKFYLLILCCSEIWNSCVIDLRIYEMYCKRYNAGHSMQTDNENKMTWRYMYCDKSCFDGNFYFWYRNVLHELYSEYSNANITNYSHICTQINVWIPLPH
jgi:hypothetical protein